MNQAYKEQVAQYTRKDGLFAIALWLLVMVAYTLSGLYGGGLFGSSFVSSIVTNLVLTTLCIALVLARKQRLSSVGIRAKNGLRSLGYGLFLGMLTVLFNFGLVPALLYGWPLAPLGGTLVTFVYQLVIIGFSEEFIFRGYIQTRLYGLFKSNLPAMAVGALLFSLMHVPFQLASGNRVPDAGFFLWLFVLVAMHLLLNFMFLKHNVLWGVTLYHAFNNTSGTVFVRGNQAFDWSWVYLGIVACAVALGYMMKKRRNHYAGHQTNSPKP